MKLHTLERQRTARDNSQVPRLCLHGTGSIWIQFENGSRLTPSLYTGRGWGGALRTSRFIAYRNNRWMTQAIPLSLKTIAGVFSKVNDIRGFWKLCGYCGRAPQKLSEWVVLLANKPTDKWPKQCPNPYKQLHVCFPRPMKWEISESFVATVHRIILDPVQFFTRDRCRTSPEWFQNWPCFFRDPILGMFWIRSGPVSEWSHVNNCISSKRFHANRGWVRNGSLDKNCSILEKSNRNLSTDQIVVFSS